MEGETGDAKCLTPSALAPPVAGLFLVRRGGLGKAVTELERKHLVETDRHIAECREYIAKQRERMERAIEQGRSTEVADIMLETLEVSLRAFERQRRLLLESAQRARAMTTTGKNRIMIYGPKDDGTYVVEFRTAAGGTTQEMGRN
jgi:hypothetical protein